MTFSCSCIMWGWMPEIDHEPREKRPTNKIWWAAWAIIIALWIMQLVRSGSDSFVWDQIALGGFTVGVLALWAIEITGNKVPDSWRGKSRR
jgi:hypothetical protein